MIPQKRSWKSKNMKNKKFTTEFLDSVVNEIKMNIINGNDEPLKQLLMHVPVNFLTASLDPDLVADKYYDLIEEDYILTYHNQ